MELDGWKQGLLNLDEDRIRGERLFADLQSGRRSWRSLNPEERRWPLVITLIDRFLRDAWNLRFSNPAEMLSLAQAARVLTDDLPVERYGPRLVNDLRARAWAELGNALRVADDLAGSAEALARARDLAAGGTGSFGLTARIAHLMVSLLTDQRRIPEAIELLQTLEAVFRRRGAIKELVKVLVTLAHVRSQAHEPEAAIPIYLSLVKALEPGHTLFVSVVHGLARNLVEVGLPQVAEAVLQKYPDLFKRKDKLNGLRLLWLEGKIALGLGDFRKAEYKLQTARLGFGLVGKYYESTLVALDVALLLARRKRWDELSLLVRRMFETFRSLGIEREALASLTLLRRSVEDLPRPVNHVCGQIEALIRLLSELRPRSAKK